MSSSIVIIANPAARGSSRGKIERASRCLLDRGFRTEILRTEKRGDAETLARLAAAQLPYSVMAAGGDGTINEVINGLALTDVPLSILPMGTTNVLARELGIDTDAEAAAATAATARPRPVSLGRIESGGTVGARFFCLMAGVGFDGKTVHDMNKTVKKVSGKAAYILSGIRNLIHYSPGELSVVADTEEYACRAVIVGKASRYGGDFKVTPDADLSAPQLYCCAFLGKRRRDLLRHGKSYLLRRRGVREGERNRCQRSGPYPDRRRLLRRDTRTHHGGAGRAKGDLVEDIGATVNS
jgi:diacylglycerol kinase (ATP)